MNQKRYQIQQAVYRDGKIIDWWQCRHKNKQRMNYIAPEAAQNKAIDLANENQRTYRVFDLVTQKTVKSYYR